MDCAGTSTTCCAAAAKGFRPDDFEAAQIRTAIDLRRKTRRRCAAPGVPGRLHRQLAAQAEDGLPDTSRQPTATRRQVIVGTSAAAAAAVAAVAVDRLVSAARIGRRHESRGELSPNAGTWQRVAASADVPEGGMHPFDLGSVIGFVRRVDGEPEAVSGVCTHQGCRLWFDAPDDRLRCPCHSTSFSPTGQVLTHQLPISPKPLPKLEVREINGAIEVFAPQSDQQT